MEDNSNTDEYHLKILVVGENDCGKQSLINQYVKDYFRDEKPTVGVDFSVKILQWDEVTTIRLQFWGIAGQERFGNMTPMYYRDAAGAFVVYDVQNEKTLEMAAQWKADMDQYLSYDEYKLPVVLLGNKCDLEHKTNKEMLDGFCKEHGFIRWFETSARDNIGIDEAVHVLVEEILKDKSLQPVNARSDVIQLERDPAVSAPASDGCKC